MKIAINGFGRIGRTFLRTVLLDAIAKKNIEVRTINVGPANPELVAHSFKYDTLMGQYPGIVLQENGNLNVDSQSIEIIAQKDPADIDWKKRGIDWVVDCSGRFTRREGAQLHLNAGAKAVLISAPAKGEDVAIIPGVNDQMFDPEKDKIVSLGSCTTNAFLTMLKVLHEAYTIKHGVMTTTHAYTNTQALLDTDGADPRRSRAAALNIVPTTTGAAKMIGKIMPELDGKITASALRVPVGLVSLIQLVFSAEKKLRQEQINMLFQEAAARHMKGILDISMEPLVSSDYIGNPYSVVIDGLSTQVVDGMATVLGWYDNEWAYSMRMKDFLLSIS